MKFKDMFWLLVLLAVLWSGVSAVRPYWDRYWLGKDMEAAALYGTKHTVAETREFLDKKMKEDGWAFRGDDFVIERESKDTVTVRITYVDEIQIFGKTVKELKFTVQRTAEEIEEMF